jgi:hypothetical protein
MLATKLGCKSFFCAFTKSHETLTAILGNRGKIIDAHTSKTFHSQSQFSGSIFENLEEKLLTWIKESDETNVLYNDTILLEKTNECYFLGNKTIYGIKNTHIQQNCTDQPCG